MRYTLTIDCDNAAFDDGPNSAIAEILRTQAHRLDVMAEIFDEDVPVMDANGNRVGAARLSS